jgi:hypothetical protein
VIFFEKRAYLRFISLPVVGDDGIGEGTLQARLVDRLAAPVELDALPQYYIQYIQAQTSYLQSQLDQ